MRRLPVLALCYLASAMYAAEAQPPVATTPGAKPDASAGGKEVYAPFGLRLGAVVYDLPGADRNEALQNLGYKLRRSSMTLDGKPVTTTADYQQWKPIAEDELVRSIIQQERPDLLKGQPQVNDLTRRTQGNRVTEWVFAHSKLNRTVTVSFDAATGTIYGIKAFFGGSFPQDLPDFLASLESSLRGIAAARPKGDVMYLTGRPATFEGASEYALSQDRALDMVRQFNAQTESSCVRFGTTPTGTKPSGDTISVEVSKNNENLYVRLELIRVMPAELSVSNIRAVVEQRIRTLTNPSTNTGGM